MIRMSKETDYGILLLTHFARVPQELIFSARELSEVTGVPLPMVSKILKMLARSDLLVSQRGAKGGYALAKRPAEITIVDVLMAMEGTVALTECIDQPGDCRQEPTCRVRENWEIINERVLVALREITLAEMCSPISGALVSLDTDEDTSRSTIPRVVVG